MGTRYNCLAEAVLTSTRNLCFEQKYEKKKKKKKQKKKKKKKKKKNIKNYLKTFSFW